MCISPAAAAAVATIATAICCFWIKYNGMAAAD
jgi:hypothetical protein